MAKLKPCPFCGQEDTVVKKSEVVHKGGKNVTFKVVCLSCTAVGPEYVETVYDDTTHNSKGKSTAKKLWNTRVESKQKQINEEFDKAMEELLQDVEGAGEQIKVAIDDVTAGVKEVFNKDNKEKFKKSIIDVIKGL